MIRAKAYMTFAPPNSQLVKELKLRTKEVDMWSVELTRILIYLGENEKHGGLTIQSSHAFPDCSAMATKLRSMTTVLKSKLRCRRSKSHFFITLLEVLTQRSSLSFFAADCRVLCSRVQGKAIS